MMLKKSLICTLAIIILSLCCTICFAAENGNNINLGNEIMKSIDKTENSMKNVVSGNVIKDTENMMRDGANTIKNGVDNVENDVSDIGSTVTDNNRDMNENGQNRNDEEDNNNENAVMGTNNNGGYNTTRTSADQTLNGGINTMTATTWMWIILIVAAVTIMAAIWYYATQDNK